MNCLISAPQMWNSEVFLTIVTWVLLSFGLLGRQRKHSEGTTLHSGNGHISRKQMIGKAIDWSVSFCLFVSLRCQTGVEVPVVPPVRRRCTMQRRCSVMGGASTRPASSAVSRPVLVQQGRCDGGSGTSNAPSFWVSGSWPEFRLWFRCDTAKVVWP